MSDDAMIERVARALLASESNGELSWEALSLIDRGAFKRDARAAIEAMREPTPAMIEAGRVAWLDSATDYNRVDVSNLAAFNAMIDAALE